MKHDDATLQAAIDWAMFATGAWRKEPNNRLALAKAFLAKLDHFGESNEMMPQPILADDGWSLGQLLYEAGAAVANNIPGQSPCDPWSEREDCHEAAEAAAQAIANVVLAQAIRRMEAVPVEELKTAWITTLGDDFSSFEAIRSRLIAAASGEAEQQADNTYWKARAEKAEAELAALKSSTIGIIRPLAQAGHVPDGCVRMRGYKCPENGWCWAHWEDGDDTHFVDVRLPSTETPSLTATEHPRQQVPLGPEDVPPCSLLRNKEGMQYLVQFSEPAQMRFSARTTVGLDALGFRAAMDDNWQINRSIPLTGKWDANAWEPCYKLI